MADPLVGPGASPAAVTPASVASPPTSPAPAPDELLPDPQFDQGLAHWTITDAALTPSVLRPGGAALNVGWRAVQALPAGTLLPGMAYTLRVKARNTSATRTTTVAVNFRIPRGAERIRTYEITLDSDAYKDYAIDFTAPNYADMAEIAVTTHGTRAVIDTLSLLPRPAILQTEPVLSTEDSHVPPGYLLAFNDEFNGTALNTRKWFTRFIQAGGTLDKLNDEQQRYTDHDTHVVADGVLSLVARPMPAASGLSGDYESGMIRSDWTARYGYVEARVRMPGGQGVWPAFWLNSDVSEAGRLSWPPEIDIFEFVNNGVEDTVNMLHSGVRTLAGDAPSDILYADPAFNQMWTFWSAPFNFNEGWHTVGALWTPDTVTVFVDGVKIHTRAYRWQYRDGTLAGPAHILLNLAIGGAWAGRHGIDASAFPQALQIDWVRAYRKVD